MTTEIAHHWVATRPGGLDVLELVAADVPSPACGEVTIAVHAVGVNPADYKRIASGDFTEPVAIGFEVSGVLSGLARKFAHVSRGGSGGE